MFRGSMVALVTPMAPSGDVDFRKLEALVEYHMANQTDAIVAVGTTGESATLDAQEHCEVIKRVVECAGGKIPIIAGTGSNSTREAIELTACAKEVGADACLLVTPYYNKPTQHGLFQHYKLIAESVSIPQILYNVPGRTVCDLLPQTVAQLAEIPNIIGIKEATGDMGRTREIIELCGDNLDVYSGDDATAVELIFNGAIGNISVTANVAPKFMHKMCAAALQGDKEMANRINSQLMPLHTNLFVEANPIPVKWALGEMGLIPDGIRLPLTPLSAEYHKVVRDSMKLAGVL